MKRKEREQKYYGNFFNHRNLKSVGISTNVRKLRAVKKG
jgi:hypothetical protein